MTVIIQHDPSGLYRSGAEFRVIDWAESVRQERWASGTRFHVATRSGAWDARMVGLVCRRSDGAVLKVHRGGRYWWTT